MTLSSNDPGCISKGVARRYATSRRWAKPPPSGLPQGRWWAEGAQSRARRAAERHGEAPHAHPKGRTAPSSLRKPRQPVAICPTSTDLRYWSQAMDWIVRTLSSSRLFWMDSFDPDKQRRRMRPSTSCAPATAARWYISAVCRTTAKPHRCASASPTSRI